MMAAFDALRQQLFTPNNHSAYEVGWREVPPGMATELGSLVLDYYGFDRIDSISQVNEYERASNNFRCSGVLHGVPFKILLRKHITRRMTYRAIGLVNDTLDYLKREGVKVITPLHTTESLRTFRSEDYFYQAFPFIEGRHYSGNEFELEEFAAELAGLHIVLDAIPFRADIEKKPLSWVTAQDSDAWRELFALARARDGYLDELFASAEDFILRENARCLENLHDVSGRQQVLHGDLHPHNTIFEGINLKAFLDFGEMGVGDLLYDVGTALHRFVRQFVVYTKSNWRSVLPYGVDVFLETYMRRNPLSQCELTLLPFYMTDQLLRKIFSNVTVYYREGDDRSVNDGELEKKLILLQEAVLLREVMRMAY